MTRLTSNASYKSRSTISSPILACSRSISRSLAPGPGIAAAGLEGARRLLLQLLLPGVNLVRVDLVDRVVDTVNDLLGID
jgi:hypothetical protein